MLALIPALGINSYKVTIGPVLKPITFPTTPYSSKTLSSFSELITFVEDRPGHDKRYAINPDKINRELLWKPQVDFETGLKKPIAWYLKRVEFVDYDASRIGIGRKK